MIKNYILSALRNIIRYKSFSLLNITSLALSMSVCLLIILIIMDQLSHDDFHPKNERIYRVTTNNEMSDEIFTRFATTAYPMGDYLREHYPVVEKAAVIEQFSGNDARYNNRVFEVDGLYVNKEFFEVFDFPVRGTDPAVSLDDPWSVILTEKTASKFYGDEDPLGKTFTIDSVGDYTVRGVIPDLGRKTHIQFDMLVSTAGVEENRHDNWNNIYRSYAYILLKEGTGHEDLTQAFEDIRRERYSDDPERDFTFSLQSLAKICPGPILGNELGVFLPRIIIYFMGILALVVMLTSAFNYTNMSLAKSLTRATEIGVRKVTGASRGQIFVQFLTESVLASLLALLLAYIVLQFLTPAFEGMKFMSFLEITLQENLKIYGWFLVFAAVTGIIAGLIPAGYISSFNPVTVFKDTFNVRILSRMFLRKFLVVAQFCVSIILVITIILCYRQLRFYINTNYGFDKTSVLNIGLQGNPKQRLEAELEAIPEINLITWSSVIPGTGNMRTDDAWISDKENKIALAYFSVNENYLDVMGLNLIAGVNFPEENYGGLERYVIVNETALERFKLESPQQALGTVITMEDSILLEVIGVVEDYHYFALFAKIGPMGLRIKPDEYRYAHMLVSSPDIMVTMKKIERAWQEVDPERELHAMFLDEEIREYYLYFGDLLYMAGFASLLAILIACMGLFGMAAYSSESRIKEIGIRKAMGAKSSSIALMISRSYVRMILAAMAIALPLSWFGNRLWLRNLPYHVNFGAGTLIAGAVFILLVSLLTILTQSLKSARRDPVDSLRYE